jgi:hypothetical protein
MHVDVSLLGHAPVCQPLAVYPNPPIVPKNSAPKPTSCYLRICGMYTPANDRDPVARSPRTLKRLCAAFEIS